jgi:AmiR/NasT family two-component response regulator
LERIILGFSKDETAQKIVKMLSGSGYKVIANCHSKAEIIRVANEMPECLVIMGFKLSDATVNEVFEDLPQGTPLISLIKAERQTLIAYDEIFIMPLPVNRVQLLSGLDVLMGGIRKQRRPKRSDDEKKVIEMAKQVLIEKHMMSEEQAHRFIQKRSMDTGAKFAETAKFILSELGVF